MDTQIRIVNINEIISNIKLTIPEYQRPYRWTEDSALALFSDLYAAYIRKKKEYRIGSVILHEENAQKENNATIYNIVDGQQRLTTITILLYCLNKSTNHLNCNYSLLNSNFNQLSFSAIKKNYNVLQQKVNSLEKEETSFFLDYVLNSCTLVQIITNDEQQAFQFFDSQNSRGKPLAPHDLLKAFHLREMTGESEETIVETVKDWENTDQGSLKKLFEFNLYPLVRWYKKLDGLYYSEKKIKVFKGIQNSNKYNYSFYHRAANLFVENINNNSLHELFQNNKLCQFQLTQPIIAGRRFFEYTKHYNKLKSEILKLIEYYRCTDENNEESPKKLVFLSISGNGDKYVQDLFLNALIFYADRFNIKELTFPRIMFFYKWAYSLRLCLVAVYKESINKYALGKHELLNSGLNIFERISEMINPEEIESIYIDISKVEKSKVKDKEQYKKIFDMVVGNNGKQQN